MAKAINWPAAFRDEVIGEDCSGERIALRLGAGVVAPPTGREDEEEREEHGGGSYIGEES